MTVDKKVPTTVFTGFLGSGKTTIISHLIKHLRDQGQEVVYVKNEIGETDLDASLMRGENFVSKELLNGCICCTLVGPFINAIEEIIENFEPDRIIIESAGTADPSAMALMVSDHPLLERDGVISIIDVLNFEGYQDLTPVAKRQAEMTDLIVLNKVEMVDVEHKRRIVGYIRELNEKSPVIEAPGGKMNSVLALGISLPEMEELFDDKNLRLSNQAHLEDDQIEAFTIVLEKTFDTHIFLNAIKSLPKNIFRVKGIVSFNKQGPMVVNSIFQRADLKPIPENFHSLKSKLIFIGFKAKSVESNIRNLLENL